MIINSECAGKNFLCVNEKNKNYDKIVNEINQILELHVKKIQLSKQTNSSWSIKNEKFIITSLIALSKLNQIYLEYLYNFSFDKNVYSILDYNMNNFLLSQKNKCITL